MTDLIAIERSIKIDALPENVWVALTDPAAMTQWFEQGTSWEIPVLVVGGTATWHTDEGSDDHAIAALEPLQRFMLHWSSPEMTIATDFRLEAVDGGTRLTINESGFPQRPGGEQWIADIKATWDGRLQRLKALAESTR